MARTSILERDWDFARRFVLPVATASVLNSLAVLWLVRSLLPRLSGTLSAPACCLWATFAAGAGLCCASWLSEQWRDSFTLRMAATGLAIGPPLGLATLLPAGAGWGLLYLSLLCAGLAWWANVLVSKTRSRATWSTAERSAPQVDLVAPAAPPTRKASASRRPRPPVEEQADEPASLALVAAEPSHVLVPPQRPEASEGDLKQWMSRSAGEGFDCLEGQAAGEFEAGRKSLLIHLAFCPTFARTPQVFCHVLESSAVTVQVGATYPYGARLELRRNGNVGGPLQVMVQFTAVVEEADGRQAA